VLVNFSAEPLAAPADLLSSTEVLLEWTPREDSPSVAAHSVTVYRPAVS
jgi:maltooligosyltrehalose trehalohydrolase